MNSRTKIASLLTLIGITSTGSLVYLGEKSKGQGTSVIIPGTWTYDVDTMRLPDVGKKSDSWFQNFYESLIANQSERRVYQWQQNFDLKGRINPKKLDFGASHRDCDIQLEHINQHERNLVPINGAELALLGNIDFSDITYEDLATADYSTESIPEFLLKPGTNIAIKTNKGDYAKLTIDGFLPLVHNSAPERDIKNYHLQGRIKVYKR